jgi:uncharacterized protein YfkK (UPF0435 family)
MNNNDIHYKYYNNYDKNVKAIRGGGVITPTNPPNAMSKTGTITNTLKNNIIPVPPMYKSKYYSNPDLTNGYLNENNYIDEDKYISDYYFPSQKLNKVDFIDSGTNKNVKKNINKSNPIKFPPPLITSKPNKQFKKSKSSNTSESSNTSSNISKLSTDNKFSKDKKLLEDMESLEDIKSSLKIHNKKIKKISSDDIQFIDYIKNNCLYDGKYIYTIENPDESILENNLNIMYFPIAKKHDILNQNILENNYIDYSIDNNNVYDIDDNYLKKKKYSEKFSALEKNDNFYISNIALLIIFSMLVIIYFSKYQK